MSRWFRWHEGTTEDGKFRVVARLSRVTIRDVIALWAFILEDAANLEHRGVCKRNEDFMASILDFDDGTVERILEAMESTDMISVGYGAITVCNWGKRQFEGDVDPTAADRQRRKRERDKAASNVPVTRDSRPSDTDTDTDTDTEKKETPDGVSKEKPKRATRLSPDWEPKAEDWLFAIERLGLELATEETAAFKDWWPAQTNGTKLNWDLTYRSWIRRAHKQRPRAGPPQRQTTKSQFLDVARGLIESQLNEPDSSPPGPQSLGSGRGFEIGSGNKIIALLPNGGGRPIHHEGPPRSLSDFGEGLALVRGERGL